MAQQLEETATAAFPDPPYFYTYFTQENIDSLAAHPDPTSLPPDDPLRYLIPPPPPSQGTYWTFGEHWTSTERHPTLTDAGLPQLFPDSDLALSSPTRIIELRRLAKSLLLSYIELVGVIAVNPEVFAEKCTDMQNILFNMHYLINQYRPHQARETLCLMMEGQIEKVREETEKNREATRRVERVLREVADVGDRVKREEEAEAEEEGSGKKVMEKEEERRRRWDREGWGLVLDAVGES